MPTGPCVAQGATMRTVPRNGQTWRVNGTAGVVTGEERATWNSWLSGDHSILVSGVNIGGRTYSIVKINNRIWMAENLDWKFDTLNLRDSSNNPLDTTTANQAAYYNYDESTYGADGNKYGLLYNWYAVDYLNNHLSELGVPSGWHVPTRAEWSALVSAVGENPGTKIKSTTGWSSGAGTDDYGFSAVPAGYWYNGFYDVGSRAYFWTSEPNGSSASWDRYILTGTSVYESSNYPYYGFSVRLVQDSN